MPFGSKAQIEAGAFSAKSHQTPGADPFLPETQLLGMATRPADVSGMPSAWGSKQPNERHGV